MCVSHLQEIKFIIYFIFKYIRSILLSRYSNVTMSIYIFRGHSFSLYFPRMWPILHKECVCVFVGVEVGVEVGVKVGVPDA